MAAFAKAPWALRIYAVLIVGAAMGAVVLEGGSRWMQLCWAIVFSICICTGNRFIWWLVVALNAIALLAAPFIYEPWWLLMTPSAIGLACLLTPESRRYVFTPAD